MTTDKCLRTFYTIERGDNTTLLQHLRKNENFELLAETTDIFHSEQLICAFSPGELAKMIG